ncbi:MAG: hypothetical protein FJ318_04020 [SAR202 cluster bacterium]|nr:hypothetical protein [SAR202 cluster bacterium]
MTDDLFNLPEKPLFSCESSGFHIYDGAQAKGAVGLNALKGLTPLLTLQVGPSNVFETRPLRVVKRHEDVVSVMCEGGITVDLDFDALAASKSSDAGEFVYVAGLDRANDGLGYILKR